MAGLTQPRSHRADGLNIHLHPYALVEQIHEHHQPIAFVHFNNRRHESVESAARKPHPLAQSIRAGGPRDRAV